MVEGIQGYADSATAGLNCGYGGNINPNYGAYLPTYAKYCKVEDDKVIGFTSIDDSDTKRIYRFHKKTGLGVAVIKDKDGFITVKFIG